jgi:hypothetical protein
MAISPRIRGRSMGETQWVERVQRQLGWLERRPDKVKRSPTAAHRRAPCPAPCRPAAAAHGAAFAAQLPPLHKMLRPVPAPEHAEGAAREVRVLDQRDILGAGKGDGDFGAKGGKGLRQEGGERGGGANGWASQGGGTADLGGGCGHPGLHPTTASCPLMTQDGLPRPRGHPGSRQLNRPPRRRLATRHSRAATDFMAGSDHDRTTQQGQRAAQQEQRGAAGKRGTHVVHDLQRALGVQLRRHRGPVDGCRRGRLHRRRRVHLGAGGWKGGAGGRHGRPAELAAGASRCSGVHAPRLTQWMSKCCGGGRQRRCRPATTASLPPTLPSMGHRL